MATAYVTLGPVETRDVFNGKQVFCVTAVYARSGSPATGATSVFCPGGVPTFIRMTSGDAVSLIDA